MVIQTLNSSHGHERGKRTALARDTVERQSFNEFIQHIYRAVRGLALSLLPLILEQNGGLTRLREAQPIALQKFADASLKEGIVGAIARGYTTKVSRELVLSLRAGFAANEIPTVLIDCNELMGATHNLVQGLIAGDADAMQALESAAPEEPKLENPA